MILSDIRRYLEQRGQASLAEIALHVHSDSEAVRGMLAVWLAKGKAHKRLATPACSHGCTHCDPATIEIYVWGKQVDGEPELPSNHCGNRSGV